MGQLTVIKSGPLSLLQDSGRFGYQHLGVSVSGFMDKQAACWANYLLQNPVSAPLIEIFLGGLQLEVGTDCWLALTGANMQAYVDEKPQPNWQRFMMKEGQKLKLKFSQYGQCGYLAVAGGFIAPKILNSTSTQIREKLGGHNGQGAMLKEGDVLHFSDQQKLKPPFLKAMVPAEYIPDYAQSPVIRFLPGGDYEQFAEQDRQHFENQLWQITPNSNRMGIRLMAAESKLTAPKRKWSLAVTPGTIQIPPDGQPIVLAMDCQTMGGYPVIGWVHPLDLSRLVQSKPRSQVKFEQITLKTMQQEMQQFDQFFFKE